MERIQAAAAARSSATVPTSATAACHHLNNNNNISMGPGEHFLLQPMGAQVNQSISPENSSTAASSDSFGTQVSPVSDLTDIYSIPINSNPIPDNVQTGQIGYMDSLSSPSGYFNQGFDFQAMEQSNQWLDGGEITDNLWNAEDIMFLQQFSNNI